MYIIVVYLQETDRSKEAFMDMLASRYPQYAEKISSTASEDGFPVRVSHMYLYHSKLPTCPLNYINNYLFDLRWQSDLSVCLSV
jgi:hypothetical protein